MWAKLKNFKSILEDGGLGMDLTSSNQAQPNCDLTQLLVKNREQNKTSGIDNELLQCTTVC